MIVKRRNWISTSIILFILLVYPKCHRNCHIDIFFFFLYLIRNYVAVCVGIEQLKFYRNHFVWSSKYNGKNKSNLHWMKMIQVVKCHEIDITCWPLEIFGYYSDTSLHLPEIFEIKMSCFVSSINRLLEIHQSETFVSAEII